MPFLIVDAHEDIAYNALTFGRDYRVSALKKRRDEIAAGAQRSGVTLGLPEALIGRVGVVFGTIFVTPGDDKSWTPAPGEAVYRTPQEAYALGLRQLDYYQRLADEDARIRLIRTRADLDAVLATWGDDQPLKGRQQGIVILMEGADPIVEPRQFEEWYERGVRVVGPAWSTTRYAAGNGHPGTLTPLGRELLEVMASFNAILDVTHLSEKACLAALDSYTGAIIASHSNPRKFCDNDRHLSDEQIRRLGERDGVIGVVLYNRFLSPRWSRGDDKHTVALNVAVDAIDHVCQLTGSARHAGIGSDFDGGFGTESVPYELDTVADLYQIAGRLQERGYAPGDVEAIMGGNMLRKLTETLP